jgi:hypothetical protein
MSNSVHSFRTYVLALGLALTTVCVARGIIIGHDFDALDKIISMDEEAVTLESGITLVSKRIGLSITFDDAALKRLAIDRTRRFPVKLDNVGGAHAIAVIMLKADPEKKLCVLNRGQKLVVGELAGNLQDMVIHADQLKP